MDPLSTDWDPPSAAPQQTTSTTGPTRTARLKSIIASLRNLIRQEVQIMRRRQLEAAIQHKRATLETGKRGIQKAMGKGAAPAQMSSVNTTHPRTVFVRLKSHSGDLVREICRRADPTCTFNSSTHVL